MKCKNPDCKKEVPTRKDKYCSYRCANLMVARKMIEKHERRERENAM